MAANKKLKNSKLNKNIWNSINGRPRDQNSVDENSNVAVDPNQLFFSNKRQQHMDMEQENLISEEQPQRQ